MLGFARAQVAKTLDKVLASRKRSKQLRTLSSWL
ncbi:MAG: hypothetical protein V8R91_08985 [Butyricimonas faecihominis]